MYYIVHTILLHVNARLIRLIVHALGKGRAMNHRDAREDAASGKPSEARTVTTTVVVPATFWDDHAARWPIDDGESMAIEVSRAGVRVTIKGSAAEIEVLRRDAEYYAGDNMDECPRHLRESARRTLAALSGGAS